MNDLLEQAAHGFDAERQRGDVEQQGVGADGQRRRLQRGAVSDDLVGVDAGERRAAEQRRDSRRDQRRPGRAADQRHALELAGREAGVLQDVGADGDGAIDQRRDQPFERGAVDLRLRPAGQRDGRAVAAAQRLPGAARGKQDGARPGAVERAVGDAARRQQAGGDGAVEIVAAKGRVAAGREHLEDALLEFEDGDVERAAAEIEDRVEALGGRVEAVGERGGGGFVHQPQHFEAGEARGVAGGGARGVVEIGGHRDHRLRDVAAERRLGAAAQRAKNIGRDLHRGERAARHFQARHTAVARHDAPGQRSRERGEVVDAAAHEALDRGDRVAAAQVEARERLVAHHGRGAVIGDDGGDKRPAAIVAQRFGDSVARDGDDRIGRAQIDADGRRMFARRRRLARFVDVEQHRHVRRSRRRVCGARAVRRRI